MSKTVLKPKFFRGFLCQKNQRQRKTVGGPNSTRLLPSIAFEITRRGGDLQVHDGDLSFSVETCEQRITGLSCFEIVEIIVLSLYEEKPREI